MKIPIIGSTAVATRLCFCVGGVELAVNVTAGVREVPKFSHGVKCHYYGLTGENTRLRGTRRDRVPYQTGRCARVEKDAALGASAASLSYPFLVRTGSGGGPGRIGACVLSEQKRGYVVQPERTFLYVQLRPSRRSSQ